MIRPRRQNPLVIALWANAILLGGILVALLARGNVPSLTPAAFAQQAGQQPPIAGGGGIFLMPGQLAQNNWGCYLMDVDRQTLVVYEYLPGTKQLRFVAGRSFKYDRDIGNFGTSPSPMEVKELVDREKQLMHRNDANAQPPAEAPKDQ